MRFDIGGPVHPSREVTGVNQALGLPALYAAVNILASGAASVPLRVYNKSGAGNRLYTGPTLFDSPSVIDTKFDWIFSAMASVLLHGNAWGLITGKDKYGFPKGIEWLPPELVYVQETDQMRSFNPMNVKVYFNNREMKWFGPDRELFHIRGFTQPGRIEGVSPVRYFANTILAGQKTQDYGLTWYNSGGFPPGIFKNQELEVDATQAAQVRAMLVSSLRRREPLVIGRDWDYSPVTVPPSEAQFIDAMQINATQIAAIYNLPPDRVGGTRGDSLTYSTVEQSTLQIIEALHPWLVRFEEAFSDLLPGRRHCKFWTDALLRTDLQTRISIYNTERRMGLRTTNEIRTERDLDPYPSTFGNDVLPLDLTVALGTRAGAIPKALEPEIDFLMDHAAQTLVNLQKEGLAQGPAVDPKTGQPVPPAQSASATIAQLVAAFTRKHPDLAYNERVIALRELSDRINAVTNPGLNGGWISNTGRNMLEK